MTLYEDLAWRGLISQTTHPDIGERLEKERFTVYAGFDPTADSLHIGSLIPLLGLVRFQRAGHRPIALIGGATGMIGDPSFKAQERALQSLAEVDRNVAGIEAQIRKYLDFKPPNDAIVTNNMVWLGRLHMVTFLRDIGKHFSVNAMIAKESVRARLEDREHGISYTEFSYQLLQAYDFMQLYDEYKCRLQVGGSDQWGNIVAGMDLARRMRDAETFGLTFPLVMKSDGGKFGKTEKGNVWLDANRTSPYKFYQFWINTADADVVKFLKFFTFISHEEIDDLARAVQDAPQERAAQKVLAVEMTELVHGADALADARKASQAMFGGSLDGLDAATLEDIFADMPSAQLPKSTLSANRPLVDVLVECGVFKSKGEARRLIQNGGLYLNNEKIGDDSARLTGEALLSGSVAVVRTGKKNYHLLKFE